MIVELKVEDHNGAGSISVRSIPRSLPNTRGRSTAGYRVNCSRFEGKGPSLGVIRNDILLVDVETDG